MSTTKIKYYSIAPYYDDFDETKNYHRVLYRPGYAVQARELTQMQTAMQAQIDRLGQYSFKDGSRVINGKVTLNVEYDYIKIESAFSYNSVDYNSDNYLDEFLGSTITGTGNSGNQVVAKVLAYIPAEGSDPNTLYVKYISQGGTDRAVETFAAGEVFSSDSDVVRFGKVGGGVGSAIANPIGQGSAANIEEGVYFISGCFTYVPAESIILDKYSNTPSYIIALEVTEAVIDSSSDATLVDNAQGVPNTSAPGANRYQITTSLIKQPLSFDARDVNNYIILLSVKDGIIQVDTTDKNQGTELTARLARRTFEESGNYSVRPFILDIKEHLNDGTNNGYLTAGEGGDEDKLAIGVEPSVAYVQGYRNENISTTYVEVDKPRGNDATAYVNASTTQIRVGNYVKLNKTGLKGAPDIANFTTLELRNSGGTQIGVARARGLETFSDHVRLYLFDITIDAGQSFGSVASVYQAGSPQAFVGTLNPAGVRFDAGQNGIVFKLPYDAIQTLYQQGSSSIVDTIYRVRQTFTTTVTAGAFSISIGAGQGTFAEVSDIIIAAGTADVITSGIEAAIVSGGIGSTTITFNATSLSIADGLTVKVITTVQKNLVQKTKTRNNNVTKTVNVVDGNAVSYELDRADIIRVVSIVDSNGTNVTDRFSLDNGQRDNYYDEGRILKIGGTQPVATGNMVITFDHYSHGSGDYFSVDSYPTSDYNTIPTFNSIQGLVQLRDCIDFRPTKASAGSITVGAEFSSGTGGSLTAPPKPGHALLADITHYLPRIDKLYITREGEFKIAVGVPSDSPKAPKDPEDAMVLYRLELKPYVFSTKDIKPVMVDNKRYTMRDIGAIDRRVKNLEYYTSLSLLEQSAADAQLFDGSNFNRFKNGFLVDGFRGHNVGDVSNSDYAVSIDKRNGVLRPKFDERNVNLVRLASDTGTVVVNKSIATLPFTSVEYINQPYASFVENVNPYDVFSWGGTLELSPESDEWKEVDKRPDIIIDDPGMYDQMVAQLEEDGILGTVWNEWQTNWSGVNIEEFGREEGINSQVITTSTAQSRTGIRTDVVPDTVLKEVGTNVVEMNFVPFIRSRKIYFKAQMMKPNTKVYAFFNDTSVTDYCKQESFVEFSTRTGVVTYEGLTSHPDGGGALVTDASGSIEGSFVIPRNQALSFKTGTREFRLSDSPTNTKEQEVTFAEGQYHAQGLLEVSQTTVISTKVPRIVQTEVNDSRTLTQVAIRRTTTWVDPLAETFLVTDSGGVFLSSVDLYFATKDPSIPVRVSIRTVENGIPTQIVVPGADVIKYPADIATSNNGSAATTFAFDYPVFLEQDQEYAIVIMAQTNAYNVYVAEMGGFDVTNPNFRITKQPYNGVFFTSQNASTWTPEQSKDLKFKLNRANFSASSGEITLVNDVIPAKKLKPNPVQTVSGSSVVRISHKNHGMHGAGSQVVISGADTFNGVDVNGTHVIGNIEHDSYTIDTGSNATATGSGGGASILATENRHMDVLNAFIANLQLPNTDVRYFLTTYSQRSIDGTEAAYQVQPEFEILANTNINFNTPKLIASAINETTQISGAKSFRLRCVLSTSNLKLSPVIDLNRASVVTVQNIVNNAVENQADYSNYVGENVITGGSELAKYITKRVDLNEEADVIKVYIDVNRPSGSAVDLYYKVIGAGTDDDFNSLPWILAPSNELIPINDSSTIFEEVQYDIDPSGSFSAMKFKIVLRSSNSSAVPRVKDFRAIAAT